MILVLLFDVTSSYKNPTVSCLYSSIKTAMLCTKSTGTTKTLKFLKLKKSAPLDTSALIKLGSKIQRLFTIFIRAAYLTIHLTYMTMGKQNGEERTSLGSWVNYLERGRWVNIKHDFQVLVFEVIWTEQCTGRTGWRKKACCWFKNQYNCTSYLYKFILIMKNFEIICGQQFWVYVCGYTLLSDFTLFRI